MSIDKIDSSLTGLDEMPTPPEDGNQPGIGFINILKWILLLFILFMLYLYVNKHQNDFRFILTIKFQYLLPIFLLKIISTMLGGFRFYIVLVSVSHRIPFFTAIKYFVIGQVFPHGGNIYRAFMLKKYNNISYGNYFSGIISFKWMRLIFALMLGSVLIAFYDPWVHIGGVSVLLLFISILLMNLAFIPVFQWAYKHLHTPALPHKLARLMTTAAGVINQTITTFKDSPLLLKCFFIILLNKCIGILTLFLLFKSIGMDTNIITLTIYTVILELFTLITITPSNLGLREFLLGFLSETMGTGLAQGMTVSVMSRLLNYSILGILSIISLYFGDENKSGYHDLEEIIE